MNPEKVADLSDQPMLKRQRLLSGVRFKLKGQRSKAAGDDPLDQGTTEEEA
jgi:hypothetical protein